MRLKTLLESDLKETLTRDPVSLSTELAEYHPQDVAEFLDALSLDDATAMMRMLSADLGADVVEYLSEDRRVEIFSAIGTAAAVELLSAMDPDDRVDVVQDLEEDGKRLLEELARVDTEAAEEVQTLVGWDSETAGGIMTTDVVSLGPDVKVWEAIEEVRRVAQEQEAKTIYYIYVVGYEKLLGIVSLRDLILGGPGQRLGDVMEDKVIRVLPDDDQEEVARVIARYDLSAVPVVTEQGKLVGLVTVDDVVDVVIDEATEDVQKMGSIIPLHDSYLATGLVEFVWKRGVWLVLLFLGQLITANVMESNRELLLNTVELMIFIPLIIAAGGNAGSQSSTLIIRALAIGELRPRDWFKILKREMAIGAMLGVSVGMIGFVRAYFAGVSVDPWALASAVGISVVTIVTLSSIIGSILPLAIRRAGIDPAVSSTPFIATLVDVLGLMVYFSVAQWILLWFAT